MVPAQPGEIAGLSPLTVTWAGGDAGSVVTVTVTGHSYEVSYSVAASVPATAHSISIGNPYVPKQGTGGLGVPGSSRAEITLDVEPDVSLFSQFSAAGLALGGEGRWRYRHEFNGYNITSRY